MFIHLAAVVECPTSFVTLLCLPDQDVLPYLTALVVPHAAFASVMHHQYAVQQLVTSDHA